MLCTDIKTNYLNSSAVFLQRLVYFIIISQYSRSKATRSQSVVYSFVSAIFYIPTVDMKFNLSALLLIPLAGASLALDSLPTLNNTDHHEGVSLVQSKNAESAQSCPVGYPQYCSRYNFCCSVDSVFCCPNACCARGATYCGADGHCYGPA